VNDASGRSGSTRPPIWRIAAGAAVLGVLIWTGVALIPVYLRNFQLEKLLGKTPLHSEEQTRQMILDRGRALNLDISPNQLQIRRLPGTGQFAVHYAVRVSLLLYPVELHFSSTIRESNGP
jgi:hypothetical protein